MLRVRVLLGVQINKGFTMQDTPSHVFVLFCEHYNEGSSKDHSYSVCRGVYPTIESLRDGVDYWIVEDSNHVLSWVEYKLGYSPEPYGWSWAYIPIGFDMSLFEDSYAPVRDLFATNLVGLGFEYECDNLNEIEFDESIELDLYYTYCGA
jgi:hypothetical protein